jgi:hypothetical protein
MRRIASAAVLENALRFLATIASPPNRNRIKIGVYRLPKHHPSVFTPPG